MEGINEKIRQARKQAHFTQAALADIVGISRTYLAEIEGGRYNPSVRVLVAIAKACNQDLNFFVKV